MHTLPQNIIQLLHKGTVIPAHPLALTEGRKLDEYYQRLLTKYYLEAGAGGIAVGVHTTQFEIRNPEHDLYKTVLTLAIQEVQAHSPKRSIIAIAGVSGDTKQAIQEASLAKNLGYQMALLSTNGLGNWSETDLLQRAKEIGEVLPLFGFYLQPAVGGRVLSKEFWRAFAEIPSVYAIKIAPFNRYQTLDVVQAVCESSRSNEIALYTGNDDNILLDLLTTYRIKTAHGWVSKDIVGGLLGHWAVWTQKAVQLLEKVHELKANNESIDPEFLTHAHAITDANAAFFDAKNGFAGCIAGIHEVLQRQGLLKGIWCLDPSECLSPGQKEEIDRVYDAYPELNDDTFVKELLAKRKNR